MTEVQLNAKPKAHVRLAKECLVAASGQTEGSHRAAMRSLIDYKLGDITDGIAGALATAPGATAAMSKFDVGFHYHDCQMQIVIILDGATDSGREGGSFSRLGKGDVSLVPGSTPHGGTEPSADYQAVEITFPSTYQTFPCDAPSPEAPPSPAQTWSRNAARLSTRERGLISYTYPVAEPCRENYGIEYQRCTRAADFEAGTLSHQDALQMLMVTAGTRDVEIEGETFRLGHSDLLVIPRGAQCSDLAASPDFEGVWIRRLH